MTGLRDLRFPMAAMILWLHATTPLEAEPICTITQITDSTTGRVLDYSLDHGSIAFTSNSDLTGSNSDGNFEVFLFDGSEITPITESTSGGSEGCSLDRGSIAFYSTSDHTGTNPEGNAEIFLYNGSIITQVTDSPDGFSWQPSLDGASVAFNSNVDLIGNNREGNFEVFLFDGSGFSQITDSTGIITRPSLHDGQIAFFSGADLTGGNPDRSLEIFLFDGSAISQITDSIGYGSILPRLDMGRIAFQSNADLTGDNADHSFEIFLFDGGSIAQVTSSLEDSLDPSISGRLIAFSSTADLTGGNSERNPEIFVFDGFATTQVTDASIGESLTPSVHGNTIAFRSTADLTGGNQDGNSELFLASCPALAPPPGPYLTSDQIPGFRFKVRITAGDQALAGEREVECLGETLCVSGALPGRAELFLRVVGPRPNGFLWTNLVRFTTSRVEVWVEQVSTERIKYYDLPALPRDDTELSGLVDKEAFRPSGSGPTMEAAFRRRPASTLASRPAPLSFTSDTFPGFRFTVRIFSGGEEQPVQVEEDCISETLCVSGALPGRSELFVRILGPRPNGFLWTNLVRFTTSRVEVEIEQLETGESRLYILEEVPRLSDRLPGRVDRAAFVP